MGARKLVALFGACLIGCLPAIPNEDQRCSTRRCRSIWQRSRIRIRREHVIRARSLRIEDVDKTRAEWDRFADDNARTRDISTEVWEALAKACAPDAPRRARE